MGSTIGNMNNMRVVMVVVVLVMVAMVVEGQRTRKKPKDKKKDLFWFKVAENSTSSCQTGGEMRWCFCGKKGSAATTTWRYLCGECKENKPFSFKIERGKGKGKGKGKKGKGRG